MVVRPMFAKVDDDGNKSQVTWHIFMLFPNFKFTFV